MRIKLLSIIKNLLKTGYVYTQYEMAKMYEGGSKYVEKDLAKAFEYYLKSADGYIFAQYTVAEMYENGTEYARKDLTKALELYKKAAAQGHRHAKYKVVQLQDKMGRQ